MKKVIYTVLFAVIFFLLGVAVSFIYFEYFAEESEQEEEVTTSEPVFLDQEKVATHLSKVMDTKEAYWQRMWVYWNEMEEEKGEFDWSFIDERMEETREMEIYILLTIMPYANWDQDVCHGKEYEAEFDPKKGGDLKVGKPCDMEAYKNFLTMLVERYDGDGTNDMPGLEIPVKYWEIMNEPSMQGGGTGGMGEELKFFVGTSEDYLEILKASYEAIKAADPDAKVVQGGMAGMHDDFVDFWEPIFKGGGGDYFDIANMHAISVSERNESLFVIRFKRFLEEYDCGDKPIWLTEVQFGSLTKRPDNLEEFEILMVKASVFSLAQGADKLFYIENWVHWDGEEEFGKKADFDELEKTSTHQVYLNLIDKLNEFDEVVVLAEAYNEYEHDSEGAHSNVGQYKFVNGETVVFVLWGEVDIPPEISGEVKVTDIYGESENMNVRDLKLSDVPIFVEIL